MKNDRLSALLREHDPAAGRELAGDDVLRIRTAVLSSTRERRVSYAVRLSFATLALVLFAGAWAAMRTREAAPAPQPQKRQIHYTTPGGTRIIWSLDPEFQL
ncbi:MAG TPA: hypothetical protein VF618_06885 [Thermoanaerobaculia bacterium]